MNRTLRTLLAAFLALAPAWAAAQAYPNKPVRLVVPFAPGGTTDLLARIISERMGATLGQTVVVENKAGAGGAIGATGIPRSRPAGAWTRESCSSVAPRSRRYPSTASARVREATSPTYAAGVASAVSNAASS